MDNNNSVAFLGFSAFERGALWSYFRLAAAREPRYTPVATLSDADFLVADADHAPSVALVAATERLADTVFIGAQAPAGCSAWMARPIDALHVARELDALALLRASGRRVIGHREAGGPATATATAPQPVVVDTLPPPAQPTPEPEPEPEPLQLVVPDPSAILLEPAHARFAPAMPVASHAAPPGLAEAAPVLPVPPRALLVDDSEIALRYLESRLQRWGLHIDTASGSAHALELLARHSYDLVFLDVELGSGSELGGFELCQCIKQSAAAVNASVVLVSAHHSELDRVRGALAGCDAYLGKPLQDGELERLLQRHGLKTAAA